MQRVTGQGSGLLSFGNGISKQRRSVKMRALETKKWDVEKQGPLTAENVKKGLKEEGYTAISYYYPKLTRFDKHSHGDESIVLVLEGKYVFEFPEEKIELGPGEYLDVVLGQEHEEFAVGGTTALLAAKGSLSVLLRALDIWQTLTSLFSKSSKE